MQQPISHSHNPNPIHDDKQILRGLAGDQYLKSYKILQSLVVAAVEVEAPMPSTRLKSINQVIL